MNKHWTCPEATTENTLSIITLFSQCYNPIGHSIDASTAISEWQKHNYHLVTENDFKMMNNMLCGDGFRLFVELLESTFGEQHISERWKSKIGYYQQHKMTLARKSAKRLKPRCTAFNKMNNQLQYIGIRCA